MTGGDLRPARYLQYLETRRRTDRWMAAVLLIWLGALAGAAYLEASVWVWRREQANLQQGLARASALTARISDLRAVKARLGKRREELARLFQENRPAGAAVEALLAPARGVKVVKIRWTSDGAAEVEGQADRLVDIARYLRQLEGSRLLAAVSLAESLEQPDGALTFHVVARAAAEPASQGGAKR